jgi:hypothetical protein
MEEFMGRFMQGGLVPVVGELKHIKISNFKS